MDFSNLDKLVPQLRREYRSGKLDEKDMAADPFAQFGQWFLEAVKEGCDLPNGAFLATSGAGARPSGRVVLVKGFDKAGFVFFTDQRSLKGRDLTFNPKAALVFFWPKLDRQVIVRGAVKLLEEKKTKNYFAGRPREAQLAAAVSVQSSVVRGRKMIEDQYQKLVKKLAGKPVPKPAEWSGYKLAPQWVEFFQGRPNRLNDRLCYSRRRKGLWTLQRLAP